MRHLHRPLFRFLLLSVVIFIVACDYFEINLGNAFFLISLLSFSGVIIMYMVILYQDLYEKYKNRRR